MNLRAWDFVGSGRRHPRWDVDGEVDVAGQELLLYQPVKDLSIGGMRAQTACPAQVGRRLSVTLTSPGKAEPIQIEGSIVWSDDYPSSEVGIRFDLTPTQKEELNEYISLSRRRRLSTSDELEQA